MTVERQSYTDRWVRPKRLAEALVRYFEDRSTLRNVDLGVSLI